MKTTVEFEYHNGISICKMYKKGKLIGCGSAQCHNNDEDMQSERVGCFIAECRANIDRMRNYRNTELIPGLKALNHLQNCIIRSKEYNPKSYEANMIRKQIKAKEKEIAMLNDDIKMELQYLREYIENKDIMYRRLRKQRDKNN